MKTVRWIVAGIVAGSLAGCGADEIASPGSGGNITINNPPPVVQEPPPPPPPGPALATAASGCPTIANGPDAATGGLRDDGTITGPTGTYRVCALPARFTASSTLERVPGLLYALDGRVDVGVDRGADPAAQTGSEVTLTIRPGVVIFAKTGTSWLAVNRGNKITAIGTAERPIVFTSRDNVLGLTTDDSQGQWGGVVLLGRAPITDCAAGTPGAVDCYRQTEGAVDPAYFGGATPTDNSGTLDYVQIRYSGYILSGNSELQALTLGGVGSNTTIRNIHTHNSSDDGFEIFGGRVNLRNIVVTGADDDSADVDTGYQGTIQNLLAVQKTSGAADSVIELDSPGTNATTAETQTPRTHLKLANFTLVHRNAAGSNGAAVRFRGGADITLVNGLISSPAAILRLDNTATGVNIFGTDPAVQKVGPPVFRSVLLQSQAASPFRNGDSGVTAQQVSDTFNAAGGNNNAAFTSTLTTEFVNGANETAAVAVDPKTLDAGFDTTTYVGAVAPPAQGAAAWHAGWTCNSATATFAASGTACTSLPSLN